MIWDNLDDLEKKKKIDAICADLLKKLDTIEDWIKDGNTSIRHKDYNIEVNEHWIIRPKLVKIPRKWRKKIRQKIRKIYHRCEMKSLSFLHDVILDKYQLHVHVHMLNDERKEWLRENANEGDYIMDSCWYYFKNESLAVAYKLRWI